MNRSISRDQNFTWKYYIVKDFSYKYQVLIERLLWTVSFLKEFYNKYLFTKITRPLEFNIR